MAGFWSKLSPGRVVCLIGADPAAIERALDPLPATAPAVVSCHLPANSPAGQTVLTILDQLEAAAVDLYPTWLPKARSVATPGGAGPAAIRTLARNAAEAGPRHGPYLAGLAAWAAGGHSNAGNGFSAEVRAAGLAQIFRTSFRRSSAALLLRLPAAAGPATEQSLAAAGEWLASCGGFAVALTGVSSPTIDRLRTVPVDLPAPVVRLAGTGVVPVPQPPAPPVVRIPAGAGQPHPASRAERALEAALATRAWAYGRVWNERFQLDPLAPEIRVDLMWTAERCAVEIDGPEHRGVRHYEADRRRDVLLQLAGFAVLRFTNTQVRQDIDAVLAPIEQLLTTRRAGKE